MGMGLICIGRCSHVCNAGFLTTDAARNKGVGIVMGEAYLHFAPRLVRITFTNQFSCSFSCYG